MDMLIELAGRRHLAGPDDLATYRSLARKPIEIVSEIQEEFGILGTQAVGGLIHNLAITPDGQYSSDSGDDRF